MIFVPQSYKILTDISDGGLNELKTIEQAGRICYQSQNKATNDGESAKKFVDNCIKRGHMTPLEHVNLSVLFITDRGVTHELVRHRLAAYNQESTRYCNYSSNKFNGDVQFIIPHDMCDWQESDRKTFKAACEDAESYYKTLIFHGMSPQEARAVLPTCTKAEIVMTANLREWRHVFELRCTAGAHPQIQALLRPLLLELKERIPVVFDDIVF